MNIIGKKAITMNDDPATIPARMRRDLWACEESDIGHVNSRAAKDC